MLSRHGTVRQGPTRKTHRTGSAGLLPGVGEVVAGFPYLQHVLTSEERLVRAPAEGLQLHFGEQQSGAGRQREQTTQLKPESPPQNKTKWLGLALYSL